MSNSLFSVAALAVPSFSHDHPGPELAPEEGGLQEYSPDELTIRSTSEVLDPDWVSVKASPVGGAAA